MTKGKLEKEPDNRIFLCGKSKNAVKNFSLFPLFVWKCTEDEILLQRKIKEFVQAMVILDAYVSGGHRINTALLWEYDMKDFDWQKSKTVVAQRVVELGTPEDFYGAFDLYGGIEGFREILKTVPYLNELDQHFVCTFFNLKKEELRCYTKKQSNPGHWNY